MRVLGIETVGTTGSVALVEGDVVVRELALDPALRSAQSLAPGIDELLRAAQWRPGDVELVAVATGPGSFTGLRIGVTTAKTFAYACGCPAIGVDTMSAIAQRVPAQFARFSVVVDAQRGELFVADFERTAEGELRGRESTRLVDAVQWLGELEPGRVVSGPGLAKWASRAKSDTVLVEAALWSPTAATVALIGARDFAGGRRSSAFELVPEYVRRTAAEEQWEKKAGEGG
jgi:tRNA threonylcarbamoyladenosine biosynthesis protein TsaB